MAEMTIRLIPDPQTGKKNIIISLTGDQDSLPHEHEQMHRDIVNKLLGAGKIQAEEIGRVEVEQPAPQQTNPPEQQRQAIGQGR